MNIERTNNNYNNEIYIKKTIIKQICIRGRQAEKGFSFYLCVFFEKEFSCVAKLSQRARFMLHQFSNSINRFAVLNF